MHDDKLRWYREEGMTGKARDIFFIVTGFIIGFATAASIGFGVFIFC